MRSWKEAEFSRIRQKRYLSRVAAWTIIAAAFVLILLSVLMALLGWARAETIAYVSISDGVLNVRSKPAINAEKVGYLEPGETVVVLSYEDGWALCEVHFEASTGYVKAEYLMLDPDASGEYVNTSGGRARIRDGMGGKLVSWLKAGATVNVSSWSEDDDGNRWAFIGKGWVSGNVLARAGE